MDDEAQGDAADSDDAATNPILLLPPTTRDGEALAKLFSSAHLTFSIAKTIDLLCKAVGDHTGAIIVSEEAAIEGAETLAACLQRQPVWSDLPVLVLARSGVESPRLMASLKRLGNVGIVERPVRVSTLLSLVRSALRARARQYEVRAHLANLDAIERSLRASEARMTAEAAALAELNRISSRLWQMGGLDEGLDEMLSATIEMLGADMGNIQLLDESRGALIIRAQRGFKQDFLDFFGEVTVEDDSACGRTLRGGQRTVIEDVETDEPYVLLRPVARAAGYRGVVSTPLPGRDGKPLGMISVHFKSPYHPEDQVLRRLDLYARQAGDYIARLRAEQVLRESEERFAFSVEAAALGTFYCPMPLGQIEWNAKCKEHFFLSADAKVDFDRFFSIIHPDDRERTRVAVNHAVYDGHFYDVQYRTVAPDGRMRWVHAKGRAYYDASGNPTRFDGVTLDITEQKRAEVDRQALLDREMAARAEAERAGRIKDEFLATLSHELRTPLNAIVGWTQIIRASPDRALHVSEGIEVIERNARAQTRIIDDLLDMSRIISGKLRLDVQRLDLAWVIREAAKTVTPAADAREIRVQLVLDPLAGPVSGDPSRLQQVFWNLLSNSIKFSPRGGRVQVLLERINSHLEVSVIDTGEGIEPDFLPHVFDRFRQADATTTRRHGGLGLGLAIVKQLVELHGGTIRVKSPGKGQGSTFVVALPLTVLHQDPEPLSERRHPEAQTAPLKLDSRIKIAGAHILVVDDEPDARNLLRRLLEECDAKVSEASTAAEAFLRLKSERPDILVSDVGMPGEDGYALIERIRALPPAAGGSTPAIALTAYARSEDRVKAVIAGFQHHLSKPVEPMELIALLTNIFNRRPRPDA